MNRLESKQVQLEKLVTEYFKQRSDTVIVLTTSGAYRVSLNSVSAQQDFGGNEHLLLVFDGDQLTENFDSELVTANHPFLDVIRNDLESDPSSDPRLSEAYIKPFLINPKGQVAPPELSLLGSPYNVQHTIKYESTFILTYLVIYDGDERSENIVRLCYSATTGKLQQDLLSRLGDLNIVSGCPLQSPSVPISLTQILEYGHNELESRIQKDFLLFQYKIGELLSNHIQGVKTQYEYDIAKLRAQDKVGRQQLEQRLQKDIQDLENKYAYQVSVRLLSVLKLWWPTIHYVLDVPSQAGGFKIDSILYALREGKTNFYQCEKCGNQTQFNICSSGHHVECAVHSNIEVCATCYDSMCANHGGDCAHCGEPVCHRDRQVCHYGEHPKDTYFCPQCLTVSFEDAPLCKDCLEHCDTCDRDFAHEHMAICRRGGESICLSHDSQPCGVLCQECGKVTCSEHGMLTAEQTWVCSDHGHEATCCQRLFALKRLEHCCVDEQESLCPDHRFECADCLKSVCEAHSFDLHRHQGQRVCRDCRQTCKLCPDELSYIGHDLKTCVTCGKQVCAEHQHNCVVCSNPVCDDDVMVTTKGERVCPTHAGTCAYCPPENAIHIKAQLQTCIVSQDLTCKEHHLQCQVCEQTYVGKPHIEKLSRCASCNRFSCGKGNCSTQMQTCVSCKLSYCSHCFSGDQCITCANLTAVNVNEKTIAYLNRLRKIADQNMLGHMDSMMENSDYIKCKQGKNQTYRVLVFQCKPPKIQFWKSHISRKQVRLVIDSSGKVVQFLLEAANK